MIICQAGKETRHWRAVGDELFEGSAKGKTASCVWMDYDPEIRVAIQGVAFALAHGGGARNGQEAVLAWPWFAARTSGGAR
jgi:hypothetical protein